MSVDKLLPIVGPLLTALSILFAIYQYRRASLIEEIRRIRLTLGEAPRKVEKLRGLLSEARFNQVGLRIADELRDTLGSELTPEQIADFIEDPHSHDTLVSCVYEGIDRSRPAATLEQLEDDLYLMEYRLRSLFPTLSHLFRVSLFFITRSVGASYEPKIINHLFKDDRLRMDVVESIRAEKTAGAAYSAIANIFTTPALAAAESMGLKMYSAAGQLFSTIVFKVVSLTDNEIIRLSAQDRSLPLDTQKIEEEESAVKDLIYLTTLAKPLFTPSEWDKVLAATTTIKNRFE